MKRLNIFYHTLELEYPFGWNYNHCIVDRGQSFQLFFIRDEGGKRFGLSFRPHGQHGDGFWVSQLVSPVHVTVDGNELRASGEAYVSDLARVTLLDAPGGVLVRITNPCICIADLVRIRA